jgi:hypothetical protein
MIFLGAGASAPFGIPTAKTLTNDIRNLLDKEHQEVLDDIDAFWRRTYEKDPNYENILTFLMGLTNPRRIPRESLIQVFVKDHQKHRRNYETIIDEMYSRIVTYCTAPFVSGEKYLSPNKLEDIFLNTYDVFTLLHREIVFTTNYDPSIEIWCQKRNIQLFDNTNLIRNPEIKEVLPINDNTVASGETNLDPRLDRGQVPSLKIVRLHGSVWVYETESKKRIKMNRPRDRLLFTDWYPHLKKRPHMIFPGQESVLASGEWDTLYQHFKKMLRGNCLVIGYSFQDETINRAFIDNLNRGQLGILGVLNPHPDEAIKNLFWGQDIPHKKIVQISAEFGTTQALEGIGFYWMNRVLHTTYPSGVKIFRDTFRRKMKSYLD